MITGTYEHLLVEDSDTKRKSKERKRKKKKNLQRSNSITTLTEELVLLPRPTYSDISITPPKIWNRQESAPPKVSIEWTGSNGIEEIPFVLEESDNSHLQDMPLPKPLRDPPPSNGDIPTIRKISSPAFLRATAAELRKLRKPSPTPDKAEKPGHKKSASVDETKRQKSPAPSTGSISVSLDEQKQEKEKKEKRAGGTFKKIFKKVF